MRAALAQAKLPPTRLELEITEGVRISMDDSGTGYSSLSDLQCFPFDKIKVGQSFIRQVPAERRRFAGSPDGAVADCTGHRPNGFCSRSGWNDVLDTYS